jgi:hypothetical protein
MKETLTMIDRAQIEIEFVRAGGCRPSVRGQRRMSRARWWFNQMRQVVNNAANRASEPAPRPEQTYLSLGQVPNWRR